MRSRTHYSYSDRLAIEIMLNEGYTIKEIEKKTKKSSSNITREISKHTVHTFPSCYINHHPCNKHHECKVKGYECYMNCKNIEFKKCPKLDKSPHVCNACSSKNGCRYVKSYYKAKEAQEGYENTLSSTRVGLHYTEEEMQILKERLCPLIINTKSVYHAVKTINERLNTRFISKTIYRQIKGDFLPVKSSDLPRARKKKKEAKNTNYKRDIAGHTYEDYKEYQSKNPEAIEMQMDTVEGIKENNAPVLLTLEIVPINFLFILKIDSQTKDEVLKKLTELKDNFGQETFDKLTEILLTDNGKEFYITDEFTALTSNSHLFYCHPYSSFEKGSIENNHELIRRVIPKGVSIKKYTQKELNLLCSHINSLCRNSLNGKCPFDIIENYIPIEIINQLGLTKIDPLEVCLIPELLGEKNVENIRKYLDNNDIKKANIKFIKN